MDFSPEILIDFGLNLAGYAIVTLLVYLVTNRRTSKKVSLMTPAGMVPVSLPSPQNRGTSVEATRMDFVAFAGEKEDQFGKMPVVTALPGLSAAPTSRQENRRAIYREARRLLAKGKSGSELLASLPITEDEIEMLSFSRQA